MACSPVAAEAGRSACCACVSIDHMALAEVDSASWCACGRIAEALCARFSDILVREVVQAQSATLVERASAKPTRVSPLPLSPTNQTFLLLAIFSRR